MYHKAWGYCFLCFLLLCVSLTLLLLMLLSVLLLVSLSVLLFLLLLYNMISGAKGQNGTENTEGKQRMKKARNELLQFLGGLAMLIGGLFLFSQKVMVSSGFGMGFLLGGVRVASGLLIIPLIIGIVWLFASGGSMGSKIMIGVGVLIIIAGVIASTTIRLQTITLYEWVIMLVLIFGGAGLLAKILLTNPEDDYGYHSRKKNRGNSYSDSIDKQIEEMKRRKK